MTVDEFIAVLQALPPESRRKPLMIENLAVPDSGELAEGRYLDIVGVDERTVYDGNDSAGTRKFQAVVIE